MSVGLGRVATMLHVHRLIRVIDGNWDHVQRLACCVYALCNRVVEISRLQCSSKSQLTRARGATAPRANDTALIAMMHSPGPSTPSPSVRWTVWLGGVDRCG